jgi:hypothetical protein
MSEKLTLGNVLEFLKASVPNPTEAKIDIIGGEETAVVRHEMRMGINGESAISMHLHIFGRIVDEKTVVLAGVFRMGSAQITAPHIIAGNLDAQTMSNLQTALRSGFTPFVMLLTDLISTVILDLSGSKIERVVTSAPESEEK